MAERTTDQRAIWRIMPLQLKNILLGCCHLLLKPHAKIVVPCTKEYLAKNSQKETFAMVFPVNNETMGDINKIPIINDHMGYHVSQNKI